MDMTIVKYLIDHGADLNINLGYGRNALHKALTYGNYDLAIYLIESGADYTIPIYRPLEHKNNKIILEPVSIQQYVDECKGIIPITRYRPEEMTDSQYNRLTELISQPYVPKPIVQYTYDE
ncbi:MAG: ankyrin repeat domain-containing protein, partial [Bacteroidaceae bacterium]|nr:ankyrin repeat domain-containing protein [Bacteroidaceae bacterium]